MALLKAAGDMTALPPWQLGSVTGPLDSYAMVRRSGQPLAETRHAAQGRRQGVERRARLGEQGLVERDRVEPDLEPPWQLGSVTGPLDSYAMVRRSGQPLAETIPGL
jgi:hypothetical protein